jgi:hypothetical protein
MAAQVPLLAGLCAVRVAYTFDPTMIALAGLPNALTCHLECEMA